MRTVTVSHNWYSFLQCSGTAVPTVFSVPSNILCQDWGRTCQAWLGLVGMKSELGHSLTGARIGAALELHCLESHYIVTPVHFHLHCQVTLTLTQFHMTQHQVHTIIIFTHILYYIHIYIERYTKSTLVN